MPEEGLMRHPVRQEEGIRIERNVLEFVFFAACYLQEIPAFSKTSTLPAGFMPIASAKYGVPTLEALIERDTLRVGTMAWPSALKIFTATWQNRTRGKETKLA